MIGAPEPPTAAGVPAIRPDALHPDVPAVDVPPPAGFGTDVDATIAWAVRVGDAAPLPGDGRTTALWDLLAQTARADVGAARILEPHLDALAILAQARADGEEVAALTGDESWGVFAAEAPGLRLDARRGTDDGWQLTGTKPWCSLAGSLTHALVTAWVDPERRALFAVPLQSPGVTPHDGPWASRGLRQIVSAPVDFEAVPATPVGAPGWYLSRQGFEWGGIGVAAVWWGGALPMRDALVAAAARENADQLALVYAGAADAALWAARTALREAAEAVDAGIPRDELSVIAARVRAIAADAVEKVMDLAGRALGPAPLTSDEDHARRVADLRIYVRQHHAERDLARLGRKVRS